MKELEEVKQEMKNRGWQNTNLKCLPMIVDICCDKQITLYENIAELEERKMALSEEVDSLNDRRAAIMREIVRNRNINEQMLEDRWKESRAKDLEVASQVNAYIDKFFEALNNCETAEGRDALRIAQTYVNSVNVETKYDNTAFIVGLAAVLSKTEISPVEELKKINRKLAVGDSENNDRKASERQAQIAQIKLENELTKQMFDSLQKRNGRSPHIIA